MIRIVGCAALAAAGLVLSAVAAQPERSIAVAPFTSIDARNGVAVELTQGPIRAVHIEGDADAAKEIRVSVAQGSLRISRGWSLFARRTGDAVVKVTAPTLAAASARNGASLELSGLRVSSMRLSARTGAELGARGVCGALEATADTGGVLDADELACTAVTARATTGGLAQVRAQDRITASASMGGLVDVAGAPKAVDVTRTNGGVVKIEGS